MIYDRADTGLVERIEATWARFQEDITDKEGSEALEALYWELVALDREDEEASLDTIRTIAESNPQALVMLTYRGLSSAHT